jgi:hypothetical protein
MKSHRRSAKASVKIVPLTAIPKEALADLAVTSGGNSKRSHRNGRSKQIKVLVIDDEESLAVAVARVLDLHGYRCFAVYNGRDAIAAAESFSPDVVLSDVMMDGTNGVDACRPAASCCTQQKFPSPIPCWRMQSARATTSSSSRSLLNPAPLSRKSRLYSPGTIPLLAQAR